MVCSHLVLKTGFFCVVPAVLLDQARLQLRDLPVSVSQVLELKACTTIAQLVFCFFINVIDVVGPPIMDNASPGEVVQGRYEKDS